MTVLGEWPVSYAEQKLYAEELVRRVSVLQAVTVPIVVEAIAVPSRNDWESAYVIATGQNPPIIPGTKLLWQDLRENRIRMFTTVYDINNGTETSGEIYPWSSLNKVVGSQIKLLATNSPTTRVGSFNTLSFNLKKYEQDALRQLIFFGTVNVTADNLAFNQSPSVNSQQTDGVTPTGSRTVALSNSAGATYVLDSAAFAGVRKAALCIIDNPFQTKEHFADGANGSQIFSFKAFSIGIEVLNNYVNGLTDIYLELIQGQKLRVDVHDMAGTGFIPSYIYGVFGETGLLQEATYSG